jgi:hypothetical protein
MKEYEPAYRPQPINTPSYKRRHNMQRRRLMRAQRILRLYADTAKKNEYNLTAQFVEAACLVIQNTLDHTPPLYEV